MRIIDKIIAFIGKSSSWLNLILVLLIVLDVILRYLFSNTKNWVLELEWHLYATIFLIGASYAMQKDEHVRVDLFYQKFSERGKAILNFIGHLFLLLPWAYVVLSTSYNFALNSFSFQEGSPNPGGLPYRYIIKFMIVFGFVLITIQAVSQMIVYGKLILKKS